MKIEAEFCRLTIATESTLLSIRIAQCSIDQKRVRRILVRPIWQYQLLSYYDIINLRFRQETMNYYIGDGKLKKREPIRSPA